MSIVVDYAPEVEVKLLCEARREGLTPDAYIRRVVERLLPQLESQPEETSSENDRPTPPNAPTIALLEQWRKADEEALAQMTMEERERTEAEAEADWEELKAGLNENRRLAGEYRVLFP